MLPLYSDRHFTFHFIEDRIVPRFHLEGIEPGRQVKVYKIDSDTGVQSNFISEAATGAEGWVDLPEPIIVWAGEAFIAVPQ